MRLPWIATLDALIEELNSQLENPIIPEAPEVGVRKVRGAFRPNPPPRTKDLDASPEEQLRSAIEALWEVRRVLQAVAFRIPYKDFNDFRQQMRISTLESMDERWVRYPDQEGREGLARLLEKGGLFGPVLGSHIASVIRGEPTFKSGNKTTFEEGRSRRYAVKQVATIRHLYDVGQTQAVDMYCTHAFPDDAESTAPERVRKWVNRDIKDAKKQLAAGNHLERDKRHYRAIIEGLYPGLERGILRGKTYPRDLDVLREELALDRGRPRDTSR